jgi:anti-sigma factor RsiW
MTNSHEHISFEHLVDLADGRLSDPERACAHVAGCQSCGAVLAQIEHLVSTMRAGSLEDPPPSAVAAARLAFRQRKAKAAASPIRRILALLAFESSGLVPAYGLRASQGEDRHLVFRAGEIDVQIDARPADGAWAISGQVLGPCGGGTVVLSGAARPVSAPLTDLCEFALPPTEGGTYELTIALDDVEIVLPQIMLE